MGYKDYLEGCIVEAGLEDEEAGELLTILESCESVDDFNAVEEYLTEAKRTVKNQRNKKNRAQALNKQAARAEKKQKAEEERQAKEEHEENIRRTGTALIPTGRDRVNDLKQRMKNQRYWDDTVDGIMNPKKDDKQLPSAGSRNTGGPRPGAQKRIGASSGSTPASRSGGAVSGGKSAATTDVIDGAYREISSTIDTNFGKADKHLSGGQVAVASAAILAAAAGVGLKIRSMIKKANSTPAKQIEKQMKELEKQAQVVAKRCKKGEITEKEARVETKKLQAQYKKLVKEAAKIAKQEAKAAATKESADMELLEESYDEGMDISDIQLAIFESCDEGVISEEDRDELLGMLEGTNIDQRKAGKDAFKKAKTAIKEAKTLMAKGDGKAANAKLDDAIGALREFKTEIVNYDDSLGEVLCGNFLNNSIAGLKALCAGLLTFGIGGVVVGLKEDITVLDGMYKVYKEEDGFSLKMFNGNKARLVSITAKLIKRMEKMKSEIVTKSEENKKDDEKKDGETTNESVNFDDDELDEIQNAIYEYCEEGILSEEDRDELLASIMD